jgi:hypothetical protein
MIIFLDSGVLGLLCNPNSHPEAIAIKQQGKSTAQSNRLDADIVICAIYRVWKSIYPGREIVIATTNVKHLSRFANALEWSEINL